MPDSYKDLTHSAAEIDAAVGKADTAVQPGDIGTAAAQDVDYFATSAQGAKADTAVQPSDLGTAALADATDFATSAQGAKADTAVQPGDLGTAALADSTDFATSSQGAKADTAVQPGDIGTAAAQDVEYFATAAQGTKADTAVQPTDLGTAATAAATDFATAAQGGKADSAIQGLKVNSSTVTPDSDKIISITIPTSASDINALPNTTKYAVAIDVSINSSTYVMTVQLKDQNGDNLGSSDSIDLPLETMVVGGSYDSTNKKVVLTLKNGETVEFSVADLVSGLQTELSASNKLNPAYINYDSTHRAVSDTEKTTWNGKQDALSSTQLDAVNSGIDSTKVAKIATNESNISKDEAALVELVDESAKNLLPIASSLSGALASNATIATDGTITITLDSALTSEGGVNWDFSLSGGTLHFSCGENSSTSGQYDCYIGNTETTPPTTVLRDNSTNPGQVATIESGNYRCTIRMRANTPAGTYTFKPMLCSTAAWDISHTYQPYRPSYQELYEKTETNENNISLKIGASDYATQNTGGTVRAWTTTDGTSTTLHISTEAPSP